MLRIVFATSELAPLAKVGGLADVASSLPRALQRLGHRVSAILPLYQAIDRGRFGLQPAGVELEVEMDGRRRPAVIWRARVNGVSVYFVESEDYFTGRSVYGDVNGDYPDNAFRFAYFSRAALAAARALELEPDVFHVHDWPTALVPIYQRIGKEPHVPAVLTIHNLGYQGIFPPEWMERLGLPRALFHINGIEFFGDINFLKGGMMSAQRLTTVSPTYAREIQTPEHGAGLDGVARLRSGELTGILNGIEPSDWDPGSDPALAASYDAETLAGKTENKLALQAELGLRSSARTPLLAAIGRLDIQKGFDLLLAAAPSLLEEGAQLVILGSGNREYLEAFERMRAGHQTELSVNEGFRDRLGRRIYAAADVFLMPSRYEPCGLGQMIALRYGTLPLVRATGGLADTIRDLDADPEGGNGFVFREFTPEAFLSAMRRARSHYENGDLWRRWVARAMRQDFSWGVSAKRYLGVYEEASEHLPRPEDQLG